MRFVVFTLLAYTLLAVTPRTFAQEQEPVITSAETTYVWSYLGLTLLETGGSVGAAQPYTSGWLTSNFQVSNRLQVIIHSPRTVATRPDYIAALTNVAFGTVKNLAGTPPVKRVELYLVPSGYSYSVDHRSWSFASGHSVAFVIPQDDPDFSHTSVRTVAHELLHAWVGPHATSSASNELAAATMENCAELTSIRLCQLELDKSPVNPAGIWGDCPVNLTPCGQRYRRDTKTTLHSITYSSTEKLGLQTAMPWPYIRFAGNALPQR